MGRGPAPGGPFHEGGRFEGMLTPTPQRQAAFVGATFGVAAVGALPAGIQVRLLNLGVKSYAAAVAMGDAYPALGSSHKFGVRYGGTGEVTTLARAIPVTQMYGSVPRHVPFPDFGFGMTAVPNTSSRWVYENNKSRPGEHTRRTSRVAGPLKTSKSMLGASAPKKSGPSSKSKSGQYIRRRRMTKGDSGFRRGARTRTTPWCRVHNRRHWCRLTRKR